MCPLQVFKEWTQVEKKKKKKKKGSKEPTDISTPAVEGITDTIDPLKLTGLVNQDDYTPRHKSKKARKRQRDIIHDLSEALSASMTTESPKEEDNEWRGVQSTSKAIKRKKKDGKKKKRRDVDECDSIKPDTDESVPVASQFLKEVNSKSFIPILDPAKRAVVVRTDKKEREGKRKRKIEVEPEMSDDGAGSDLELNHGNLAQQIKSELAKRPNKKCKVVVENITQFQKEHLAKAGIEFVERKDKDTSKLSKQMNSIANRMESSLNLGKNKKKKQRKA